MLYTPQLLGNMYNRVFIESACKLKADNLKLHNKPYSNR